MQQTLVGIVESLNEVLHRLGGGLERPARLGPAGLRLTHLSGSELLTGPREPVEPGARVLVRPPHESSSYSPASVIS